MFSLTYLWAEVMSSSAQSNTTPVYNIKLSKLQLPYKESCVLTGRAMVADTRWAMARFSYLYGAKGSIWQWWPCQLCITYTCTSGKLSLYSFALFIDMMSASLPLQWFNMPRLSCHLLRFSICVLYLCYYCWIRSYFSSLIVEE